MQPGGEIAMRSSSAHLDYEFGGGDTLERYWQNERWNQPLVDTHPSQTGSFACWGCRKPVRPLPIRFNVTLRSEMNDEVLPAFFCGGPCIKDNWPQIRNIYCLASGETLEHPFEAKERAEAAAKATKDAAIAMEIQRKREEMATATRTGCDEL